MASYKGYGLAAVVTILSSLLPGLGVGENGSGRGSGVGHFFLAIDPGRFRQAGEMAVDVDALIDSLHACKPLDARRPVLVAGDPEHATLIERQRSGIPLTRGVIEDLRSVARASGVPFILDAKG
jgi:LDH2 family malate/lactate/ureidoglycolate dehydrogenase